MDLFKSFCLWCEHKHLSVFSFRNYIKTFRIILKPKLYRSLIHVVNSGRYRELSKQSAVLLGAKGSSVVLNSKFYRLKNLYCDATTHTKRQIYLEKQANLS